MLPIVFIFLIFGANADEVEDLGKQLDVLIESLSRLENDTKKQQSDLVSIKSDVLNYYNQKIRPFYDNLNIRERNKTNDFDKDTKDSKNAMQAAENEIWKTKSVTVSEKKNKDGFLKNLSSFVDYLKNEELYLTNFVDNISMKASYIDGLSNWVDNATNNYTELTINDRIVARLESDLYMIERQVQLQQFNEEEKTRSDGISGIKQVRSIHSGGKNYFSNTHNGMNIANIHDHSNHIRTVGMGEFVAVLNGFEFRTTHNDYRLKMPATSNKTFGAVDDIKFPAVPPSVLSKTTVDAQIAEMREYFRAFQNQDKNIRDYTPYFKPVLVYLEGGWMKSNADQVDQLSQSDRHFIDALNWNDLHSKSSFTSYSGTKSKDENLAHLPTAIIDFTDNKEPIFAQWNYRILCHPLGSNLPTSYFKPIFEIAAQNMTRRTNDDYVNSTSARFDLEGIDVYGTRTGRVARYTYLDSIMEEIPGMDNYNSWVSTSGFDAEIVSANPKKATSKLNEGYYHRAYNLKQTDAMGINTAQRGYSDRYYIAFTTQEKVAGTSYTDKSVQPSRKKTAQATFAIPLEVIYLTPLSTWNPYNISHMDTIGTSNNEDGSLEHPFTYSLPNRYSRTPDAFFKNNITSEKAAYYKPTPNSNPVLMRNSGIRTFLPEIPGVDNPIRLRYPIMPVHGEGSATWKKLNAMLDTVKFDSARERTVDYYATNSSRNGTKHTHVFEASKSDLSALKNGISKSITVTTERSQGHTHQLKIIFTNSTYYISECDGQGPNAIFNDFCFDGHPAKLTTSI